METISWDQFDAVELRVGTIVEASEFPEAHQPAYKLRVDFGEEIGITGKQVIGVVNFPPKQIGPIMSECLITGFYNQNNEVVLAVPDQVIANGSKLC